MSWRHWRGSWSAHLPGLFVNLSQPESCKITNEIPEKRKKAQTKSNCFTNLYGSFILVEQPPWIHHCLSELRICKKKVLCLILPELEIFFGQDLSAYKNNLLSKYRLLGHSTFSYLWSPSQRQIVSQCQTSAVRNVRKLSTLLITSYPVRITLFDSK